MVIHSHIVGEKISGRIGTFVIFYDYGYITVVILVEELMSVTVSKSKFKAKALEYLRELERTGNEIVITDRGNPVAIVKPYDLNPETLLDDLRGTVIRYDAPTEPVVDRTEWSVFS